MAFWSLNLAVILKGIEYIRILQGISAPILLAVGLLLLAWAYRTAGGFGPMLSAQSKFATFTDFLRFLVPALNGTVGFWATVSLNIPDFTRFAKSQRQQAIGQAIALPTTMTFYSLIGILVTSATVVIYGAAVWDPVQLLSRFHSPVAVVISLFAILLATLNVNIGANVVSPANDFSNLWPRRISFRAGGVITCFIGIALMPWKLLSSYSTFIFGWLGGYAAFLGPVAGIMICDYFVIRRRILVVDDLYLREGVYEYSKGVNWLAVIALLAGAGAALVGLVVPSVRVLYDYSWFVGFAVSFVAYYALMQGSTKGVAGGEARRLQPL
jgi:NCS1 family nucleobase:cation symporter-1